MGFPRQEYWGRLPFLSPRDLPYPKIDQTHVSCIAGGFLTTEPFVWSKIYFLVTYIIWSWSSPMDHHATSIFPFPRDCSYFKTAFSLSFIHLLILSTFPFIHLSAYFFNEYLYFLDLKHSTGRKILQWKIWVSYGIPQLQGTLFSVTHAKALSISHSVMFDFWWLQGLQHARLPCPSLTPRAYSNSCPSSWWRHPTISSSVIPFSSHLQTFPASGSFQVSQFFISGGQSIGVSASASVLPMNIQDWFPLGLTDLISL